MEKNGMVGALDRFFGLTENGTNIKTEMMAGLVTYMTMSYILAVNPNILGAAGMNRNGVVIATALASMIATLIMGLWANKPLALSAGLGLNAFFAYTVVLGMKYSWQNALFCVLLEGIIFMVLSLVKVREAIFDSIPKSLKMGVTAGIGGFIALIGLVNGNVVVADGGTIVSLIDFNLKSVPLQAKVSAVLTLVGLAILIVMSIFKVRGAILYSIFITWILGMLCQAVGIYVPLVNDEAAFYSLYPNFTGWGDLSGLGEVAFCLSPSGMKLLDIIVVTFTFMFTDIFDTAGTVVGVAAKANMLDKEGKLPGSSKVFFSDAAGTTVGAVLGTSTVTTFVESSAGVAAGGRTGLTAVVTAILFGLSIFMAPLFVSIPSFATAPALIYVGFLMFWQITQSTADKIKEKVQELAMSLENGGTKAFSAAIDDGLSEDIREDLPAYIAAIGMPFMYSISDGLMFGFIAYTITHLVPAREGEKVKKLSPMVLVLSIIFILKYIFI